MDWRYLKKGLLTGAGKTPDMSRRYVVARDLQCGGTWQSPPPEDAKECVPGPQPGLFRGSYCSGHAPRIASRRPRANHSGVTPGTQGIHMTQNLYYSVEKQTLFRIGLLLIKRPTIPCRVPRWRFDLDDIGSQVSQYFGAQDAWRSAQIEDPIATQRARSVVAPSLHGCLSPSSPAVSEWCHS